MDKNVAIESWIKIDDMNKNKFINACLKAATDEDAFRKFRREETISMVIENTPSKKMYEIIAYLEKHWPQMVATSRMMVFASSETVGDPAVYPVKIRERTRETNFSPTTIRYILTLHYLYKLVGMYSSGMKIVEIGGGYGGFCKIIHDIIKPSCYVIYDLPEVHKLQKRFLGHFGIPCEYKVQGEGIDGADLVISWCAWSELESQAKQVYLDSVIAKSNRCVIGCNYDCQENEALISKTRGKTKSYIDNLDYNIIYF
jgi:hypothetical protein